MRKIDKNCDHSTSYKTWEENLEAQDLAHPTYNSSNGQYYGDVIMQLYRCQKGLCAYTEIFLCKSTHYTEDHWQEGSYFSAIPKQDRHGDLDHFDPDLKKEKAWLWDNFFMVETETNSNRAKGNKNVDPILKPDSPEYDPFKLLDYDPKEHIFFPKEDLQEDIKNRIEKMLLVLGINRIPQTRRSYLRRLFYQIFREQGTWDDIEVDIDQFPTAFIMCKMKIERGEIDLTDLLAI